MQENIDTVIAKYGQRTPKKPSKSLFVLLSVVIILVIAASVVGGLILLKNKQGLRATAPTTAAITSGPTAKSIVDTIATNQTIMSEKNYAVFRTSAAELNTIPDTTTVTYTHSGYDFLTNVAAEDGLVFTLKGTKVASDKAAMTKVIETTLTAGGFTKKTQDTASLSSYATTTYLNEGTVCQIVDFATGSKQSLLEQAVLCNTYASIESSYANVKMLLGKADPAVAVSAKTVHQTITANVQTGKEKLLTLIVLPKDTASTTTYYYATLDTNYEYLGKRATPSVDNESSYTLSAELKKNISDPKWGTFLTDSIK